MKCINKKQLNESDNDENNFDLFSDNDVEPVSVSVSPPKRVPIKPNVGSVTQKVRQVDEDKRRSNSFIAKSKKKKEKKRKKPKVEISSDEFSDWNELYKSDDSACNSEEDLQNQVAWTDLLKRIKSSENDQQDEFVDLYEEEIKNHQLEGTIRLNKLKMSHEKRQILASQENEKRLKRAALTSLRFVCPNYPLWSVSDNCDNQSVPFVALPKFIQRNFNLPSKPILSPEVQQKRAYKLKVDWTHQTAAAYKYVLVHGFLNPADGKSTKSRREKLYEARSVNNFGNLEALNHSKVFDYLHHYYSDHLDSIKSLVEPTQKDLDETQHLAKTLKPFMTLISKSSNSKNPEPNLPKASDKLVKLSQSSKEPASTPESKTECTQLPNVQKNTTKSDVKLPGLVYIKNDSTQTSLVDMFKNFSKPSNMKPSSKITTQVILNKKSPNESSTEVSLEVQSETLPNVDDSRKNQSQVQTVSEPESEPCSETLTEPLLEASSEPRLEASSEPRLEASSESRLEASSESRLEASSEIRPEALSKPSTSKASPKPTRVLSQPSLEPCSEAQSETYSDAETHVSRVKKKCSKLSNEEESSDESTDSMLQAINFKRELELNMKKLKSFNKNSFIDSAACEGGESDDSKSDYRPKNLEDDEEESDIESLSEIVELQNSLINNSEVETNKHLLDELHKEFTEKQEEEIYQKYFKLTGNSNSLLARRQQNRVNLADQDDERMLNEAAEVEAILADYRRQKKFYQEESLSSGFSSEDDIVQGEIANSFGAIDTNSIKIKKRRLMKTLPKKQNARQSSNINRDLKRAHPAFSKNNVLPDVNINKLIGTSNLNHQNASLISLLNINQSLQFEKPKCSPSIGFLEECFEQRKIL